MVEYRIDPDDGRAYTFLQTEATSQGNYGPEDIKAYWDAMVPVNPSKAGYQGGSESIKLTVIFNDRTSRTLEELPVAVPWQEIFTDFPFLFQDGDTISDLATWIESIIEGNFSEFSEGQDDVQVQLSSVWRHGRADLKDDAEISFEDEVVQHFKSGDTVIVEAYAVQAVSSAPKQYTEQELKDFRKGLRFGLNDRVLCNCGRWVPGHIVGTAVPNDGMLLPYLVKTDKLPELPSNPISVPEDSDEVCRQEVCFEPNNQLWLTQAAAIPIPETCRPKLRFKVGDNVCCRVRSNPEDDLEQWESGEVNDVWPRLPVHLEPTWDMGEFAGRYAEYVPYQVLLAAGRKLIYCHRDDHTLIRREGMQPSTRVKGISKRLEIVKHADGSSEMIDHVTERRKPCVDNLLMEDDSDSD